MIFKFLTSTHETLNSFKLFSGPMDRAVVLHALSYDIERNWKNTPGKFNLAKLVENEIPTHLLYIVPTMTATQHARGQQEDYSPRRRPSLRVTSGTSRSVNFASAMRFCIFGLHFGPGDVNFL